MSDLKALFARIKDTEATANIDATAVDPRVRAGVEANVRNAKSDLDRVNREYMDALMNNVVLIGVTGETAAEFAASAEKAGAISVDFDLIVNRLANNLAGRAVGLLYTSDAHFKLIDELSKIRLEYDIVRLPNPQVNAYNDGIYDAPLLEAIRKLLLKNYGAQLQSAVTKREIGKKGLAAKFTGKKLPVIVYNLNGDVDTNFLSTPVTVIKSNGKVTDNGVRKKLSEVKNLLTKNASELTQEQTNEQTDETNSNTQEEA